MPWGTFVEPRAPLKKDHILSELRRQITSGRLKPGCRLPTRAELRDHYDVSIVTVQDAVARLAEEGFVLARGKSGTYVSSSPPHLCHYGFVFSSRPSDRAWSLFPMALCNEATALESARRCKFHFYQGVNGHEKNSEYERLWADVQASRLAGLIVLNAPEDSLAGTPLAVKPPLPVVAICAETSCPKVSYVYADWRAFFDKALDHLARRGRRRVGLIADESMEADGPAYFFSQLPRHGITSRPCWLQVCCHHNPLSARNAAHLLLQNKHDRPDGLILADDNIVENSVAGIIEANVRVPHDVEVVAYCNFPWAPSAVLPVKRMGYHARQILEACLNVIDRRRRGESTPRVTRLDVLDGENL